MVERENYIWRIHLLPKSGWKALLLIPALLLAGLVGFYLGGVILLFLALFFLLSSLRDFLFPLTYQLDSEGIKLRGLLIKRQLRWDEIEEIKRERGVLLFYQRSSPPSSHLKKPFVVYTNGNEEEIWVKIESLWKRSS